MFKHMKEYYSPDFDELEILEEQLICESEGTDGFNYDPSNPSQNYVW